MQSLHRTTRLARRLAVPEGVEACDFAYERLWGEGSYVEKPPENPRQKFLCYHFLTSWLRLSLRNAICSQAGWN